MLKATILQYATLSEIYERYVKTIKKLLRYNHQNINESPSYYVI